MTTSVCQDSIENIEENSLKMGELIGQGSYGEVFKGFWQGRVVAIKRLFLKDLSKDLMADFNNETAIMAKCQSPEIVKLFGISISSGTFSMVMEFMHNGSLHRVLHNPENKLPWKPLRIRIAVDIGKGLHYLHQQGIIFRDLKSLNVLLDENYQAKICDFGLAKIKIVSGSSRTNQIAGTIRWTAPELFDRVKANEMSDIYSYGMVLWELATRRIPFDEESNEQLIIQWVKKGERESEKIPEDCPDVLRSLIEACWSPNPQERPTAIQAITKLQEFFSSDTATASPKIESYSSHNLSNEKNKNISSSSNELNCEKTGSGSLPWKRVQATQSEPSSLNPKYSWKLRKEMLYRINNAASPAGQWYKKITLLPADPEYVFVANLFNATKPRSKVISKIHLIYNSSHLNLFEAELVNIDQEAKKFLPSWQQDPLKDERAKVIKRWLDFTKPYSPVETNVQGKLIQLLSAKVMPLWHGSSEEKCTSICESGFTYFGKHLMLTAGAKNENTDIGFFGSGIYFTNSARYATMYSRGHLLLAWVSMREPFPVISDTQPPKRCSDMQLLEGKGAFENYNAHMIPVVNAQPDNPRSMYYRPCYKDQTPAWDELVVFQKAQTLPAFWVELADDPEALASAYSFSNAYNACQAGNLEQLKTWYKDNANFIKDVGEQGENLLYAAVRGNQQIIVDWLYQKVASLIDALDSTGSCLLHVAAAYGHRSMIKWILARKADFLHLPNKAKLTPLQVAALSDKLADFNPSIELLKEKYPTLIFDVVKRPCLQSLKYLIEHGWDAFITNSFNQTLLHLAAEAGQEDQVRYLISLGLKVGAQDRSKRNPLFMACIQGHRTVVQLLLNLVPLDAISIEGETVLHIVAFYGYTPILQDILNKAAITKSANKLLAMQDQDGKAALHKAVWGKPKPDVVQLLLDTGADPNVENNYGYTPLHWAAKHGHVESAKILMKAGAQLDICNKNGDFPLTLALRFGQDELVHLFLGTTRKHEKQEDLPKDVEGYYFKALIDAKKKGLIDDQLFYLEKLSEHFVEKKNFLRGAKVLNCALALLQSIKKNATYENYLFARLERIEGLFLETKQIKMVSDKRDYIRLNRENLRTIRQACIDALAISVEAEKIVADMTFAYRALLKDFIEEAMQFFGPSSVKWSAFGMGSMARAEMLPYADFKFAFIIDKTSDEAVQYFRNLTEFLELRLTNLGESAFPIFGQDEPSPTPHGLSMSSKGFGPLGMPHEYLLIGTSSELAQFQKSASFDKHPTLAKLLHAPIYIAGDEKLHSSYAKKLESSTEKLGITLLNKYFTKPFLNFPIDKDTPCDLFQLLHKPFEELLVGLALYFDLKELSTIQTIDALAKKGIFSQEGALNLKNAFRTLLKLHTEAELFYKDARGDLYFQQPIKDPKRLYFTDASYKSSKEIYKVLELLHKAVQEFLSTKKKQLLKQTFALSKE